MQTPIQFLQLPQFLLRGALICAGLLVFGGALCGVAGCEKKEAAPAERFITLETDPPGSEVFLDGTSLGATPCTLSAARLQELGLPWPASMRTGNALTMNWEQDAGGIIIRQDPGKEAWRKLFFKPAGKSEQLVDPAETPWGAMGMVRELDAGGADDNHLKYRVICLPSLGANGLALTLKLPPGNAHMGADITATLACLDRIGTPLACFRPEVKMYCSRYEEPAARAVVAHGPLPDTWRFFKPGETNAAAVKFKAPAEEGEYFVFTVVTLYQGATGGEIYDELYSDGKLLRVGK